MLKKLQKSNNKGFTIIEVMIVLAIAGLIILIVLLAVPALQRNGRNTAIKNDASAVAAGVSEYSSNNDGKAAVFIGGTGSVKVGASSSDSNATTAKVQGGTAVTTVTAAPTTLSPGTIQVWPGHTCSTATGGTGQTSARAYSVYYSIETSSANTLKCLDS